MTRRRPRVQFPQCAPMTKSIWNSIAGVYDWFFTAHLNRDIPMLLKLGDFKKTDKVLDYGGGTGRVAEQIKNKIAKVLVADPAFKMLKRAKKKNLETILINDLPTALESESFDTALAIDSLHHFRYQWAGLMEIYRVLKPGGVLIIEEPHPKTWVRLALWIENIFERVHFFTPEELQLLVIKIGFCVEKNDFFAPSYFLKLRKPNL